MAPAPTPKSRSRRLSLDLIHRAVSDLSTDGGIFKYMDLKLPSSHHASSSNIVHEVSEVKCECCGLSEDCTSAYVKLVRDKFCGSWVCGLCSEAVKEEEHSQLRRIAHRHIVREEALSAHMEVCKRFNSIVRKNPAMSLAGSMAEILRSCSKKCSSGDRMNKRGCNQVLRSYSDVPSHCA